MSNTTSGVRRSLRIASKPNPSPYTKPIKGKQLKSQKNKGKEREPPLASQTTAEPENVYLRVNQRFLLRLNTATAVQANPVPSDPEPNASGNLYIIRVPLRKLRKFAHNPVDWLIAVAKFILEPRGSGILLTFQKQTVQYWLDKEMDNSWRQVIAGEELQGTIYEYRAVNDAFMLPTKISHRPTRSVTTNTSRDDAAAFRTALLQRHPTCIISGEPLALLLVASHLIPRRLGDQGVQAIFERFTGLQTQVTRYHESLGDILTKALNAFVDDFQVGFWNIGPDQYEIHSFSEEDRNIEGSRRKEADTMLHLHRITLVSHSQTPNPPSGVFDWHYVQCVLKHLGTEEYKNLPNISHFEIPCRTEDDDDSEIDFDDPRNIENPPYPSYYRDLAWSRMCEQREEAERHQEIERWRSDVCST